ncbi:hypothetical protein QBC35DRAFT_262987 [Podospora australis]|uniref:Uncharacterized protein n=1 Tax=Podospora australis TaxID=1536484 RepID=A0AAN7AKJ0_9PEZI|nr:hypothetical protein QBC35DRAFT_262987 [Podospora australis]
MSDSETSDHDPYLRLRFNRDPQPQNEESQRSSVRLPSMPTVLSSSLPPLRSLGNRNYRPAATSGSGARSSRYRPGERSSDRQRLSNFYNPNPYMLGFEGLDQAIDADLQLTTQGLLDLSNISSSITPSQPARVPSVPASDTVEESRRVKRRKLGSENVGSNFQGFRYGREGQAEPGRLNMEIVSCDGGLYSESDQYPPENILKDDSSVYCTKGNRCNIVLQHQGTTVFSLTELIIKAPGSSYSCPVREGMVFVAMKSDELLRRTAQYQIQYAPQPKPRNTLVYSVRHNDDGSTSTRTQRRVVANYAFGLDDDDEEYRTAQIPAEFTTSPPPFCITTECTDEESEGEYAPAHRAARRRTPNRIGALPFESDTSDDGADAPPWGPVPALDWDTFDNLTNRRYAPRGGRHTRDRTGGANDLTLEEAQEASQIATQEAVRAVGGELMAPLAHFFIEKHKNKCTIRFDPPVSGRFILLKMWSPTHNDPTDRSDNIDIEKVTARGFAGPRYFPDVELA